MSDFINGRDGIQVFEGYCGDGRKGLGCGKPIERAVRGANNNEGIHLECAECGTTTWVEP